MINNDGEWIDCIDSMTSKLAYDLQYRILHELVPKEKLHFSCGLKNVSPWKILSIGQEWSWSERKAALEVPVLHCRCTAPPPLVHSAVDVNAPQHSFLSVAVLYPASYCNSDLRGCDYCSKLHALGHENWTVELEVDGSVVPPLHS